MSSSTRHHNDQASKREREFARAQRRERKALRRAARKDASEFHGDPGGTAEDGERYLVFEPEEQFSA